MNDNDINMFIFTCNPAYGNLTLYEFGKYDETWNFIKWLGDGVGLAETELSPAQMYDCIINKPVIFVRHVFFVIAEADKNGYEEAVVSLCRDRMSYGDSFSVQTRWGKNPVADVSDISKNISGILQEDGYILDVSSGKMIVSLYIDSEKIYAGVNEWKYNLSHRKGGMPHYSPTDEYDFVSRAEYKLLEAIECFNIDMSSMIKAADLGAAPGGWTKVLIEKGLECVSVDPNKLNESILKNEKVKYYRMSAETYLKINQNDKFDILVNDMKINASRTMEIVNSFYTKIKENGTVIVTLKLPNNFSYKKDILDILKKSKNFTLINARHLFHNRNEITAVFRRGNV